MSPPPGPPLGEFRIARTSDSMPVRIGIVATAAFRYSNLFRWERPNHEAFPENTLLSYRKQFSDALKKEEMIVLVAEDDFKSNENEATDAKIPFENGWTPPADGEKVIVGVVSIKLERLSKRLGQFKSNEGIYPELLSNPTRDLNLNHYYSWGDISGEMKKRHCAGFSMMDMLAVHPAYWKRGHGTKLVQWGIDLAKLDNVTQGVSAVDMGAKLYRHLGYTFIYKIAVIGDEDDPQGVSTELLKFRVVP